MNVQKMLKSHIATVLKQAINTFSEKSEAFHPNFEILKSLLEKSTAEDVNLPAQFMGESIWQRPNKAPVTYVDMYEDLNLTMGIFILKPNMKLPLHNHPQMYGLIKIIAGKVKVTSYSINTEKTKAFDEKAVPLSNIVTAEKCGENLVDINSECCTLEPNSRNLHEIESVGGPAAFIDILAPPYETIMDDNSVRNCTYYKLVREISPSVFRLQEMNTPSWFWCDTLPYCGPELKP